MISGWLCGNSWIFKHQHSHPKYEHGCLHNHLHVNSNQAINETLRIDQFPQFFEDSMLNYAENMLRPRGSGVAVKCMNELSLNTPKSVTWDELREMVRQTTDAMKSSGLHAEDVVISKFQGDDL